MLPFPKKLAFSPTPNLYLKYGYHPYFLHFHDVSCLQLYWLAVGNKLLFHSAWAFYQSGIFAGAAVSGVRSWRTADYVFAATLESHLDSTVFCQHGDCVCGGIFYQLDFGGAFSYPLVGLFQGKIQSPRKDFSWWGHLLWAYGNLDCPLSASLA